MIYMGTFREMAGVAADPVVDMAAVRNASPLVHALLALVLLLAVTVLGVYKPLGVARYGLRKHEQRRVAPSDERIAPEGGVAATDPQLAMPYVLGRRFRRR